MKKYPNGRRSRVYPGELSFLRNFVDYNPETGRMVSLWKYASVPVTSANGYSLLKLPHRIDGVVRGERVSHLYRVDHLAWFLMTEVWPDGWIDHLNGLLSDNAIENLVFRDRELVRWWYGAPIGAVLGDDGMPVRELVQVDDDPVTGDPAVELFDVVTPDGNKTIMKPRVSKSWAERVRTATPKNVSRVSTIEPAPPLSKGEFGKDWT